MADEQPVVESKASPEQQAAAEKIGWIPPTRFKGDVERFVDADEYIKRGETVLPIVKEHNKRLVAETGELKERLAKTEAALTAATKAIEEINERHTVATQKAVETARRELKQQLVAASEAGDHAAIAELTEQMVDLTKAETKAEGKTIEAPAKPPEFVPPPELVEWNKENPWYGKDRRKTALALGIAQELRESGETRTGRAFFDLVTEEMEKTLPSPKAPEDKVEGARNGSAEESRTSGKKSYNHLPADAKAACDADAREFVGPTKKYKDVSQWRARYAELYFQE